MIVPQQEFQEKNVKKAVAKACRELKIDAAKLDYKIISHGSSGIFGLVGSRKAKIQVNVPITKQDENPDEIPPLEKTEVDLSTTEMKDFSDPVPQEDNDSDSGASEQVSLTEAAEYGQSFLQHIVDAITSDTTINRTENNKKISYDVAGGNSAILIGKHGQTLEALQFLTERAVNRKKNQRVRVEVDVAGYQAKRRGNLVDQAKRMADKADHKGKPVTIGPMSPQDRRVIHMTLKSDPRVRTQSTGQGVIRKLTIYPKKRHNRTSRKR